MVTLTRQERKAQEAFVKTLPKELTAVPTTEWPLAHDPRIFAVWRSRYFLVQAYQERDGIVRLTINRTTMRGDRWKDGISWERLQAIKSEVGYGEFDAVEIFPREGDEVNVSNMRHLWVLPEPVPYAWRRLARAE